MDWPSLAEAAVDAACRRASGSADLLRGVLDELHSLLALRGTLLYQHTGGPPRLLHGTLVGEVQQIDPAVMRPDRDPLHRIVPRLSPRPRVVHASAHVARDELRQSAAYRHFYRPQGIDHVLCIWVDGRRPFDAGMTGMFLARGQDQGAFELEHIELVRNALPLLTAAAHRLDEPVPPGPWLQLDTRGEVVALSAAAELRLIALRVSPAELSSRLWGSICRWRGLRTANAIAGQSRAVFHLVERRRSTLFVEVTERGGQIQLRLLDRRHVPALAELRERHRLTGSEVGVLQALALGLSNGEAADYLCVSEETVKTHVRRVLAKLGLQSRLQAGLLMQRIVMASC